MYDFTDKELKTIFDWHEFGGIWGPSVAYRTWHKIDEGVKLTQEHDVEGFIISFMSQYNDRIRQVF